MTTARALTFCAMLLLLHGCRRDLGPAPVLTGVEPAFGSSATRTPVSVRGKGFSRRIKVDFGQPDRSAPAGGFVLELLLGETSAPLEEISFVDSTELSATVPADLPEGTYGLRLTDAWGRSATLDGAFTVTRTGCLESCDDGLPCTEDVCEAGQCRHVLAPGHCLIAGSCRAGGEVDASNPCRACDPTASTTDWIPRAEGQPCDDGDACTTGERCVSGTCGSPTSTVTCGVPVDTCQSAATCDPATGTCGSPRSAPDGTPCDDGYACTVTDTCRGGRCRGTHNGSCPNSPPLACLTVDPAGTRQGTTVTLDASCSSDLEEPTSGLRFRFDFLGNGTFTPFSTSPSATHAYVAAGSYPATVEVQDSSGSSAFAVRLITVASPTEDVVVTTAADEDDPDATPQVPGGTGLSLREAIQYVNGVGARIIRFSGPMTLQPTSLPQLSADGAAIVGRPGVVLDFARVDAIDAGVSACVTLAGADQRLIGIEALNCPGPVVQTLGSGSQIVDSRLYRGRGNGAGVTLSGMSGTLGPRTEIFEFPGVGVQLRASGNTIDGARIHRNRMGIEYASASINDITIQRSQIHGNASHGIAVTPSATRLTVRFNTIDGNGGHGIETGSSTSGLTVQDNLLTRNGGAGLCGPPAAYVNRDPNGFFGNDGGTFCQGAPDAGSKVADPLYLGTARGDFRLQPGSPMIDVGVDLGVDVNGPAPDNFNGPAPDLGANEAPQEGPPPANTRGGPPGSPAHRSGPQP